MRHFAVICAGPPWPCAPRAAAKTLSQSWRRIDAGRLYDLGFHPGAIESSLSGEDMHGEAVRMPDPAAMFIWLDIYEASARIAAAVLALKGFCDRFCWRPEMKYRHGSICIEARRRLIALLPAAFGENSSKLPLPRFDPPKVIFPGI